MKSRLISTLVILVYLSLLAACAPRSSPIVQPELSGAVNPAKAPSQSEWEILVNEAKKEGKIVIYGSTTVEIVDALSKAFKAKYGIEMEYITGRGTEILQKIFRERRAGLYFADLTVMGASTFFNLVESAKITVPIEPLLVLQEIKDPAKWRAGKLPFLDENKEMIALAASPSHYININTNMVKETEVTSFSDLLSPKWKEKIVINDPTFGEGRGLSWFIFMMTDAFGGEQKGAQYMKNLVLQKPILSRDQRLQVEWVAKGKYPVGLGLKPTEVSVFMDAGAPIKFVVAREGGPLSSGSLNFWAYDRAPHSKTRKLFINWIMTREAGEIMQRTSGYASERADVSKQGLDPTLIPGPKDEIKGRSFEMMKEDMAKAAAEIFKDLLK